MRRTYFVYILASRSQRLYIGVTGNLHARVRCHRDGQGSAFTRRYRVHRLVHVESYSEVLLALAREKQLKGWLRERKVRLIEAGNPEWHDLMPESRGRRLHTSSLPREAEDNDLYLSS